MIVKIVRVPGILKEVAIEGDSATVADIVSAADMKIEATDEIRVNSQQASASTQVEDGDNISLSLRVKGN